MSDLKWITLSFTKNLIETIARDVNLTEEQRDLASTSAKILEFALTRANSDVQVEELHHCFHQLGNEVYKIRLRHYKTNPKQ